MSADQIYTLSLIGIGAVVFLVTLVIEARLGVKSKLNPGASASILEILARVLVGVAKPKNIQNENIPGGSNGNSSDRPGSYHQPLQHFSAGGAPESKSDDQPQRADQSRRE